MKTVTRQHPQKNLREIRQHLSLLVADVDGTLITPEKTLTQQTLQAIKRLKDNDIAFTIVSGRAPRGMKMFLSPLNLMLPVCAFNGALMLNSDLTAILEKYTVSAEKAGQIIRLIEDHGADAWVYTEKDWFVPSRQGIHVDEEIDTVQFEPIAASDYDWIRLPLTKITAVSDDTNVLNQCAEAIQHTLKEQVTAERSKSVYLDITDKHGNKGQFIDYLSKKLEIPCSEIVTIGDMSNDLLMFQKSGLSIAMGNAGQDVQAQADYVTDSSAEEGFAHAVDWILEVR